MDVLQTDIRIDQLGIFPKFEFHARANRRRKASSEGWPI
jgi:hypothetical protein